MPRVTYGWDLSGQYSNFLRSRTLKVTTHGFIVTLHAAQLRRFAEMEHETESVPLQEQCSEGGSSDDSSKSFAF